MAGPYTCPVCGWSAARDPSRAPSLCRLQKESAIFASKGVVVSPGEWARLQRENRRIGPLEEALYRLQEENQQLKNLVWQAVKAAPTPVDESLFEISDSTGELRVKEGAVLPSILTVPSQIRGTAVTELAFLAFGKSHSLKEVTLPEGMTRLGNFSFRDCVNLQRVYLPASLRTIAEYVFYECRQLAEIHLPEGLQELGEGAFGHCESLSEIRIPDSVKSIGRFAFFSCDHLHRVDLPAALTVVENYVFYDCRSLLEIEIPDGVKRIEYNAFLDCANLRRIILPRSWKKRRRELEEAALPTACRIEYR